MKKTAKVSPTVRPCSQTIDIRAVRRSLRKQQSLGDHSGLGARKSEKASRGMALYSVRADWQPRVGRDMSRVHGTGGVGRGVGLAGNEVELERGMGSH